MPNIHSRTLSKLSRQMPMLPTPSLASATSAFTSITRSGTRRPRQTLALWAFLFVVCFVLLHQTDSYLPWGRRTDSNGDGSESTRVPWTSVKWGSWREVGRKNETEKIVGSEREEQAPSTCGLPSSEQSRDEMVQESWHKSMVLNGPPTERFRDNLRNDTHYITSWAGAGFTNQFMNYVNMIYLATLTDRVPIVPPFAPDHHITAAAGVLYFGDVFDLEHLRKQIRYPVLEWRDVKILPNLTEDPNPYPYRHDPPELISKLTPEPLGCWSTRIASYDQPFRAENVVYHIGVDASYTRIPQFTRLRPDDLEEPHMVFSQLAALIYPRKPIREPGDFKHLYMQPAPRGHAGPPEGRLSCFDTMYYATSGAEIYEYRFGWSPAWRNVGKHLRFSGRLLGLGERYLRQLFGLREESEVDRGVKNGDSEYGHRWEDGEDLLNVIPLFIAVHVRHGDFNYFCNPDGSNGNCYPPLASYKKQVEEVRKELLDKKGLDVKYVIIMSDEGNHVFWEEVESYGWLRINHEKEQTLKRFGEWFPPLIDIVVQSFASGFVGTDDSTFSLLSQRRVQDWNAGVVRSIDPRAGA